MSLNAREFRRRSEDFFGASYLTAIGIIQSVSMGVLAARIYGTSDSSSLFALQTIGSLLAIILIAHEYSWLLLLIRRTPSFADTIIPYVLGFAEFMTVIYVGDDQGRWYLGMGTLGTVGIFALWNNRGYCNDETFDECAWLTPLAIRNMNVGMILIAIMTFLMFWMWVFQKGMTDFWKTFAFIEFYVLSIIMLLVSAVFLNTVKETFQRELKGQRR